MTMRNTLSGLLVAAAAITAISMPAAEARDPFGYEANRAAMQMWLNQQAQTQGYLPGTYNPYVNNIYNPYYNSTLYPNGFTPYVDSYGNYPYGYRRSTNVFGQVLNSLF
ncbi:MAG: hypothetical protein K2X77_22165 [Candidatus Obscuribacterales bacterium]|nr:hypothetical protein [Candidatus Obscuribacterales bacterium]